jgi:hypothetical protein
MNSWKLNAIAGHHYRKAICDNLGCEYSRIYKEVKSISPNGEILTAEGKKFKIILKEVKNEDRK